MELSRFTILDRIASGGMGDVLLARQEAADQVHRLVAIKRIRADHGKKWRSVDRFRNEARVVARLAHPNIVQMYDFGVRDGELFLVLEYVHGRTLSQILNRASQRSIQIPMETLIAMGIDLCRGLHYAQELRDEGNTPLQLVHRDLSPSNVIISFEGAAKILDFGLAKTTTAAAEEVAEPLMGKLGYLAPEQIHGLNVDRRADLFALGVTLWEATTGTRLFPRHASMRTVKDATYLPIPALAPLRSDAPPGWEGILRRALQARPEDRYATAVELQSDVEMVARFVGCVASNFPVVKTLATLFPEAAIDIGMTSTPAGKPRVLLVDDEIATLDLFERALRNHFEVCRAASVPQAMEVLAQGPFDVVVTDERMPHQRGVNLLEHVARTSPFCGRMMVTAFAEHETMMSAINQGNVQRLLIKPVRPTELLAAVKSVVSDRKWAMDDSTKTPNVSGEAPSPKGHGPFSFDELTETFEIIRKAMPPQCALPWEAIRTLVDPIRKRRGRAATLFVALASRPLMVAEQEFIQPAIVEIGGPSSWIHVEGHQIVVVIFDNHSINAQEVAQQLRGVLNKDGPGDASIVVGGAPLPAGQDVIQAGQAAEANARLAWSEQEEEGTEHVRDA
ncbi:serine/threonine-protein kinase [Myxococcota bacterium]